MWMIVTLFRLYILEMNHDNGLKDNGDTEKIHDRNITLVSNVSDHYNHDHNILDPLLLNFLDFL